MSTTDQDDKAALRRRNLRTALWLLALAAVFFFAFVAHAVWGGR